MGISSTSPKADSNKIIQGLWIGPELSLLEQLSIASFLRNGHEYYLYVYDEPRNIPAGTTVKDANQILPGSSIFQYREYASYAGFANFFRYKILLEHGGWWADSDTICLRPFDFPEEYVFSSELCDGRQVINCGVIKTPRGSPVMAYAWEVCRKKDPQKLNWGETGPRLMGEAVTRSSLEQHVKPYTFFCPLSYSDWSRVLEPETHDLLNGGNYAIHLWNEMWRKVNQDKNARYPDTCLFEKLKRNNLVGTHRNSRIDSASNGV